jgi:hypothetical protein
VRRNDKVYVFVTQRCQCVAYVFFNVLFLIFIPFKNKNDLLEAVVLSVSITLL